MTLDENAISVQCRIEACNARVNGDVRCSEHGGDPTYEWRHSDWGTTEYRYGQPSSVTEGASNAR